MLWGLAAVFSILARAGGGGSSGGSIGGGSSGGGSSFHSSSSSSSGGVSGEPVPWVFTLVIMLVFGIFLAIFITIFVKMMSRVVKANKQAAELARAAESDPAWAKILTEVKTIFLNFQRDWAAMDLASMKKYLADPYFQHVTLMLTALKGMGRSNPMSNVTIAAAYPSNVKDVPGEIGDGVDITFTASADDKLVQGTQTLTSSQGSFTETWQFTRTKAGWQLDGIKQATEDANSLVVSIKQFADRNQLYFSPDWGRLLLPVRGQLFGQASFVSSDVNNHCIGLHKNILIELYTYAPVAGMGSFTVAQATLPKAYENIVVRRKGSFAGKLKGLKQQSMEWEAFNERYEVYATDIEQVTSFELLHPAFMEKLFDLPFEINIEAIDNVVYLYSASKDIDYPKMMEVLQNAFKELKL